MGYIFNLSEMYEVISLINRFMAELSNGRYLVVMTIPRLVIDSEFSIKEIMAQLERA